MRPSAYVIYNPAAGRGKARRCVDTIRKWLGPDAFLVATERPGHAVELAQRAAREGYSRVVAAGGDGTVHEVANGMLLSGRDDMILSVIPLGSSNDYAYALGLDRGRRDHGRVAPVPSRTDVGVIRWAGRERYFVNGVGVGFNGMVTIESRSIRSLRGLPLYTIALLRAMIRHFATPDLTIRFDGESFSGPTLALSISLGVREGGFPLFRAARLDDGWFETLHVGRIKRFELIRYLPAMIMGRLPSNHPAIQTGRCQNAVVQSPTPLCVHADGEMVCIPADGVSEFEVTMLPGRLQTEWRTNLIV